MTGFDPRWIAAAQHERDRRAGKYPALIANGELEEEWANSNYQAWCAIAEWLEQAGSARHPGDGGAARWAGWTSTPLVILVGWPAMESAAESQLATLAISNDHRDAIWCIHNLMVKQRELVEPTLREATAWARPPVEPAQQPATAAAA